MLIITLIYFTGVMGTRPLIPLLSSELEASTVEIGLIVALFPLLPFFFAIKIGQVVDRIGHKKPIIGSTIIGSLALGIPLFIPTLTGIYISQIVAGICQTVYAVSAQTFVSNRTVDSKKDDSIMIFSIGVALGTFVGPMLGGLFSEMWQYPVAFGLLGGIAVLSSILALFIDSTHHRLNEDEKQNNIFKSFHLLKFRNIRIAFLVSILILLGKDIYTAYFPLLALEFGLSNSMIGLIVSINAAGGILIRWLIPYLLNKFTRSSVVIGSIIGSGFFFFLIPFFESGVMLGIVSFLLGLGLGLGQPLSISTTAYSLPKDRVGEGLGLRLTANRLTQMSAPVLFGGIAQLISLPGIFWIVGIIILIGGTKAKIPNF